MADTPSTLGVFIAQLKHAEIVPRPDSGDWKVHIDHVSAPGRIAAISEEEYDYWLDVLPPKWMHGGHFCFAEGVEAFRLFWHDRPSQSYLSHQLTWEETTEFCLLAHIPLPS